MDAVRKGLPEKKFIHSNISSTVLCLIICQLYLMVVSKTDISEQGWGCEEVKKSGIMYENTEV